MSPHRPSGPRGVNHPNFTRISPTIYRLRDPTYPIHTTLHVAQIAEFLKFDEEICLYHDSSRFKSYPAGYPKFSRIWNDGAPDNDSCHFSTLFLADDVKDNDAEPSDCPVRLSDFYITAAQAGLDPDDTQRSSTTSEDAAIVHEYVSLMAAKQKRQREYVEERCQQRVRAFDSGKLSHSRVPNRPPPQHSSKKRNKKSGLAQRVTTAPSDNITTPETSQTSPEGTVLINPTTPVVPMEVQVAN